MVYLVIKVQFPHNFNPCQAHEAASGPIRKVTTSYPVPAEIQALMECPIPTCSFTFTDPVEACLRLLLLSPLGADAKNLAFYPEDGDLEDYCNGDRLRRIHASLPQGAAALTCTLFFDEINRDEKGFNTGDGAIVVGGFFRARARESTDSKVSFGTFPKVRFPACNRDLDKVKLFLKRLRHSQMNAIYRCFTRFNDRGGAVVQLQTGTHLYLARAVILAIYADFPAARKITLTGSGCVQCFVSEGQMSVDNGKAAREPRTRLAMSKRKRKLLLMSTTGTTGCKERADKRAKSEGVDLLVTNGMQGGDNDTNCIFGADPAEDNVWQNMPQVSLHGMDEGLTSKLNLGCLRAVVLELMEMPGKIKWSKAAACRRIDRQVRAAIANVIEILN